MTLYVAGSLAFDRIMTFPGKFEEHILPEKLHILNVCFLIDNLEQKRGGTGGNIAYSLAMLGEKPVIVATAGRDFGEYETVLTELGLPLYGIHTAHDQITAGAYITTDLSSNQITGFYPAAMNVPSTYDFADAKAGEDIAIIGPTNFDDMRRLPGLFRQKGIRYVFDPGQQIPLFSGEELLEAITGSSVLISNDYEMEMICSAARKTRDELRALTGALIVTLGEEGSIVYEPGGQTRIDIAPAAKVVDPTGCGDSYRSGLLKGMAAGLPMPECARLGAACASFCVESAGPQGHTFTREEFASRYEKTFGPMPL